MDVKALAMKNAAAAQQSASIPSGCKACQHTGIPVLPLRTLGGIIELVKRGR